MTESPRCADCGQELEVGFIPDATYGAVGQSHWHPGEANEARFLGLKSGVKTDWSQTMPVTAYRCAGCGLIKLYAIRESE